MSRVKTGLPGILGKHPTRDDFLAEGNRSHEFTSFDAFLTRNIEWAEAKAGPEWPGAYDAAGLQAFVYRPTSGGRASALIGGFAPSWDRAGRRFPLTVAMPLFASPELLAAPEVLPLVLESCWQSTSELLLSLTTNPDANVGLALNHLAAADLPTDDAFESYAAWTRSLPASELWTLIFGTDRPVDPARVLAVVSETAATCRGIEQPTSPLALRLPLGEAGGAAVCFWLDWVCSVARWKATVPSFFWSHNGREGTMLLALGHAPPCTLAELWSATGTRDEICDVAGAPWAVHAPRPDRLWLSTEQCQQSTVAELLHAAHAAEF